MSSYALLCRVLHTVRTPAFECSIVAEGRVRMSPEEGLWWCNGVEPGAITESGEGPKVAFQAFSQTFRNTLSDLAEECGNFEEFQRQGRMLFVTDTSEEKRWMTALDEQRRYEIEDEFKGLPEWKVRPSTISFTLTAEARAPLAQLNETTVAMAKAA